LIDNKVPAFFSRIVACFSADRGGSGGSRVAVQHKQLVPVTKKIKVYAGSSVGLFYVAGAQFAVRRAA